jgi:hypothetical protein
VGYLSEESECELFTRLTQTRRALFELLRR